MLALPWHYCVVIWTKADLHMDKETLSISELRAGLSCYLAQVQAGMILVVTVRGKSVAQIMPFTQSLEDRMQALVGAGFIQWSGRKLRCRKPVARTRGERTVADLLIEDGE
jgi:prevent-host-death family protein